MGAKLNSEQTSERIFRVHGMHRGPRQLAQMRYSGTGPKYYRDGKRVIYDEDDVDEWAVQRRGTAAVSTSEEAERRSLRKTRLSDIAGSLATQT
jgi:hypothetical protein